MAKMGHNKRNQGDIIIRHNYVAVGLGRLEGQGDEWVGGWVSSCSKIVNERDRTGKQDLLIDKTTDLCHVSHERKCKGQTV